MEFQYTIRGGDFSQAGFASADIKKKLRQLNVPSKVIRRAAVAMYEAEINMVIHADGGEARISMTPQQVEIIMEDQGPGIPDINKAMEEGFSTASEEAREMGFGAGLGLPNMKRNCDQFELWSELGKGTRVTMMIELGG